MVIFITYNANEYVLRLYLLLKIEEGNPHKYGFSPGGVVLTL
jgi:hypothetical protein